LSVRKKTGGYKPDSVRFCEAAISLELPLPAISSDLPEMPQSVARAAHHFCLVLHQVGLALPPLSPKAR